MLRRIKEFLEAIQPVDQEVGVALISKLPIIKVAWEREGEAIVGMIETDDGKSFETYAHNPIEFIGMVNDAVFSVYEIPHNYRQKFFRNFYQPQGDEMDRLMDGRIPSSVFEAEKNYRPVLG